MSEFSDPSDSETEDFSGNKLTVTESLLLATLPSSAISLTHFLMPRHNRENVTEISKTVTVTEIVKASSEKHPRSCEVTITNVESGSNHPISVKISHLHDSHNTQKQQHHHRSISTRTSCPPTNHQPVPVQLNEFKRDNPSPNIVIKEDHPDAVSLNFDNDGRAAMFKSIYSTHTEDRKMIAKVRPEATFKQVTDNIIDLEFTHPILIDQKTAEQDKYRFTDFSKTQTPTILYYRPFFEDQQKNLPLTESSVGITVTPFLPRKAESNVVKVIPNNTVVNLTLKTDELENNAKHHSENKWHKQFQSQSSARIPDGMYSQKATSERKTKIINYVIGKCDSEDKSQLSTEYITAAFTESEANENISLNKTTKSIDLGTPREITRSFIINKSAKKFENHTSETNATYTKQLPRTHLVQDAKELSEMTIIKPDLITQKVNENEISVAANSEEEEVPPKPPRKTKYVMEYTDEKKRVSVDHASQTSLLKTSTPLTALEKKNKYVEDLREGDRIIPTTTMITKSAVHHDENLYVKSPRRIPSSPIIVINQSERKSSADLLEQIPRTQRKSTVTDIDWFSAFNMKEPMSPRSLKCPLPIDALRKNESISIESLQPTIRSSAPLTLLKTSQINLDDVFSCLNTMDFKRKKCQCNACRIIATPDEVREILDERNQTLRGKIISCEESRTPSSMENFTPVADINLDDIFVLSLVDPDSQRGSSIITKHEDDNEGTSPQRSLDENVIFHT